MRPDPTHIFKGTAWYYSRYRRPYPKEIFEDLIKYFHLNGSGALLDLGCGTGELVVPLAPHFKKVIGLDPNPEMLREARRRAKTAKVKNIRWVRGTAESIDRSYGPLRLTTTGVSFHWMNHPVVLKKAYQFTEKGGGMAIINDHSPVRGKTKTEPWKMKRKELIIKYLGEERRAGDTLHRKFIPEKRSFKQVISESPFKTFDFKVYEYSTRRTIDEIVGFLYSTSYANKCLFGDQATEFEHELRTELLKLVPSNVFEEGGKAEVFLMRK